MKHEPTLEERIKKLHEDIDAVVAKYVDQRAAQVIGVPRGSVEGSILGRAGGCHCGSCTLPKDADAKTVAKRLLREKTPESESFSRPLNYPNAGLA